MSKSGVVNNCRTRARTFGLTEHFTQEEWEKLLMQFGNRCIRCSTSFIATYATADHVVPLTSGGNNTIDNIQPLCLSCNSHKHLKTIDYRVNAPVTARVELLLRPVGKPPKPKDESLFTIRIPSELHEQLVKLAEQDTRSLNGEILALLREALVARERK